MIGDEWAAVAHRLPARIGRLSLPVADLVDRRVETASAQASRPTAF